MEELWILLSSFAFFLTVKSDGVAFVVVGLQGPLS